jgi:hypothetical protein
MQLNFLKYLSYSNLIITLIIIVIVIIILVFSKAPRSLKIIYSILFALLLFYVINKANILKALNTSYNKYIIKNKDMLYQEYLNKYKHRKPETLAFIASRNLGQVPIYYINLDRSSQRREKIETNLSQYGIKARRIPGIDGKKIKNLDEGEVEGIKFISFYLHTPSEIGCMLSHFKAVNQAYDDGHHLVFIFEDDISFDLVPHWKKTIHQMIDTFPSDWTVMNLRPDCDLNEITSYKNKQCWSAGAYLINRKGMEDILKLKKDDTWIIKKPKFGICDEGVADCILYTAIPGAYAYHEPLFFNSPLKSVIGNPDRFNHSVRNLNKFSYKK